MQCDAVADEDETERCNIMQTDLGQKDEGRAKENECEIDQCATGGFA